MMIVVAKCKVKEGLEEDFIKLADELVIETIKEKGCISYSLLQDMNNGQIITFLEYWENKEALEIHGNTEHFKAIVPRLSDMQVEETEVNIYENIKEV